MFRGTGTSNDQCLPRSKSPNRFRVHLQWNFIKMPHQHFRHIHVWWKWDKRMNILYEALFVYQARSITYYTFIWAKILPIKVSQKSRGTHLSLLLSFCKSSSFLDNWKRRKWTSQSSGTLRTFLNSTVNIFLGTREYFLQFDSNWSLYFPNLYVYMYTHLTLYLIQSLLYSNVNFIRYVVIKHESEPRQYLNSFNVGLHFQTVFQNPLPLAQQVVFKSVIRVHWYNSKWQSFHFIVQVLRIKHVYMIAT